MARRTSTVKVPLEVEPWAPRSTVPVVGVTPILRCLPFAQSGFRPQTFVHRVRRGWVFWHDGRVSHYAVNVWCGQSFGSRSRAGRGPGVRLFNDPTGRGPVCRQCELRAERHARTFVPDGPGRRVAEQEWQT